ncbi:MAG TPA: hydrogenase maturation protease, partial [Solirubrobacteraceae bacterium]|nr:hydrogenase maturation protease [Solirubrobacteraceae bacterium]
MASPSGRGPAAVVVIGIGNELRGDDAAGLQIVRLLRGRARAGGIAVHEHEGEPLALIEVWDGARGVVLVDAARSGAPPGTIHRLDASQQPVGPRLPRSSSTHGVGLAEAIELARSLDRLPQSVLL